MIRCMRSPKVVQVTPDAGQVVTASRASCNISFTIAAKCKIYQYRQLMTLHCSNTYLGYMISL